MHDICKESANASYVNIIFSGNAYYVLQEMVKINVPACWYLLKSVHD